MRAYYLLVQMRYGMCVIGNTSRTAAFFFRLALCAAWSPPTHQAMHMQLHRIWPIYSQTQSHYNRSDASLFVTKYALVRMMLSFYRSQIIIYHYILMIVTKWFTNNHFIIFWVGLSVFSKQSRKIVQSNWILNFLGLLPNVIICALKTAQECSI